MSEPSPFTDAEAWLAERGVSREPLVVAPEPSDAERPDPDDARRSDGGEVSDGPERSPVEPAESEPGAPVSAGESTDLAVQADLDAAQHRGDADALPAPGAASLGDDVTAALAFVRRSTAGAPQSEQRIADKLRERGWPPAVVERSLEQARRAGLVDDAAMVAALVAERRAKGHAPARIRRDLRSRGFADQHLDEALAEADREDPEAAAFALAQAKAERCTGLEAQAAYRRVAAHVARRGYPDALAGKVAREAVFAAREQQRAAEH